MSQASRERRGAILVVLRKLRADLNASWVAYDWNGQETLQTVERASATIEKLITPAPRRSTK